jgi:hypothetical protein
MRNIPSIICKAAQTKRGLTESVLPSQYFDYFEIPGSGCLTLDKRELH